MRRHQFLALLGLLALLISAVTATGSTTAKTYKLGVYKGTTSQGRPIAFRLAIAVCPPQMRGGNQHQRKGYCYQPIGDLIVEANCADKTPADDYYPVFSALLTAAGKVSMPKISSDHTKGSFHLTVKSNGTASGTLSNQQLVYSSTAGKAIKCPSGLVTFKLHVK